MQFENSLRMSEKEIEETVEEQVEQAQDYFEGAEEEKSFFERNLIPILIGMVVLFGAFFGIRYWMQSSAAADAATADEIWRAEVYLHGDNPNYEAAINGDSLGNEGFAVLADELAGTTGGNIATYDLGIAYLNNGQYEEAIEALSSVSFEDQLVSTIAIGAIGDAYMQLDNKNEAIAYYKKAITNSNNSFTCPIYLKKCALAHETLGQYNEAITQYERIEKEFPESAEGKIIAKYLAKARAKVNG